MTVATLAFLHFEAPDAPASRSVVVVASAADTPASFIADLWDRLNNNPFVVARRLSPSFASSLIGTNGAPATRTLVTYTPPTWTANNVTSLITLIGAVNSYNKAMDANGLQHLAQCGRGRERSRWQLDGREAAITRALNILNNQLRSLLGQLQRHHLAGPGTALPITVLSGELPGNRHGASDHQCAVLSQGRQHRHHVEITNHRAARAHVQPPRQQPDATGRRHHAQ
jgi:hypothetical protein